MRTRERARLTHEESAIKSFKKIARIKEDRQVYNKSTEMDSTMVYNASLVLDWEMRDGKCSRRSSGSTKQRFSRWKSLLEQTDANQT